MLQTLKKTLKNIPHRAASAMAYSLSGLSLAFKKEESIRLETIALILLVAILALVPWPIWKKITLIAAFMLIPLTELLNSALEDLCDLVSPQYNEKIKSAKDKASAAVLIAIIIAIFTLFALIAF
ncbi:MAG: diacylglycerol kinase [Deltaproteobacteria bacterium]|jgi:diacylglycerol kinase (ATP)|nr:diacylglycerol kinase [Deltaproteobacteria bacterium]